MINTVAAELEGSTLSIPENIITLNTKLLTSTYLPKIHLNVIFLSSLWPSYWFSQKISPPTFLYQLNKYKFSRKIVYYEIIYSTFSSVQWFPLLSVTEILNVDITDIDIIMILDLPNFSCCDMADL